MHDFNNAPLQDQPSQKPITINEARKILRADMLADSISVPNELTFDGKFHRFSTKNKDPNDTAGFYCVHADGHLPVGVYGDWRRGIVKSWCAKREVEFTPIDRQEYDAKLARLKIQREELAKERTIAAQKTFAEASPVGTNGDNHPYLKKKGLDPVGDVRIAANGRLLIPRYDAQGNIQTLERIDNDGEKKLFYGAKAEDSYFPITGPGSNIYICEGYATGVSIWLAMQCTVYCAFTAGNIYSVTKQVKEKFPTMTVIICADNDQFNPVNAGVTAARKASAELGVRYFIPRFQSLDGQPKDYDDLRQREGLDAIREQLTTETGPSYLTLEDVYNCADEINSYIDGFLYENYPLIIHAKGGCGKSLFVQELALALGIGDDYLFLGKYPVHHQHYILMLQSENTKAGLKARIRKMCIDRPEYRQAASRILFPTNGNSIKFTGRKIDTPAFESELIRLIDYFTSIEKKPTALIMDPLVSFHDKDENSTEMRPILDTLGCICEANGITPAVVHHDSKAGGMRGSTSIFDWASVVIKLEEVIIGTKEPSPIKNEKSFIMYQKFIDLKSEKGRDFDHEAVTKMVLRRESLTMEILTKDFLKTLRKKSIPVETRKALEAASLRDIIHELGGKVETAQAIRSIIQNEFGYKSDNTQKGLINIALELGFLKIERNHKPGGNEVVNTYYSIEAKDE